MGLLKLLGIYYYTYVCVSRMVVIITTAAITTAISAVKIIILLYICMCINIDETRASHFREASQ